MEEARDNSSIGFGKKGKSKKEVILEAQRVKKKVHFSTLMDTCHLKKCGVRTQIAEVHRQSRAPGDIVKDDSGACSVFTEQGSSASQMTAAKIMDIIARLQTVMDKQLMQYPPTLR